MASNPTAEKDTMEFKSTDDLDLCLYYLRTLSNIYRWAPDAFWDMLARRTISNEDFPEVVWLSKLSPRAESSRR
jgi:hypothetical protein